MSTSAQRLHGGAVDRVHARGEVAHKGVCPARPFGVDGFGRSPQPVAAASGHHHVGALSGEALRHPKSKAAARGENEGAFAGEAEIHGRAPEGLQKSGAAS
jgi:hypothetical protein